MKAISQFDKIYIYRQFVDFRKSINGLSTIVAGEMGLDLRQSSLFIFFNQKRSHMMIIYFNWRGFALWLKKLEESKFSWPKKMEKDVIEFSSEDIELMLAGVNIWTRFESVYFESII